MPKYLGMCVGDNFFVEGGRISSILQKTINTIPKRNEISINTLKRYETDKPTVNLENRTKLECVPTMH